MAITDKMPQWLASSILLIVLFLAASANASSDKCVPKDMAVVKFGALHPVAFCDFYLERTRVLSPFEGLDAARTECACRCIKKSLGAAPSVHPLPNPTYGKNGCSKSDMALVKKSFRDDSSFCHFYNARPRTPSCTAIPGLSSERTYEACKCILKPPTTTTMPFCSSTPVISLLHDKIKTAFCQRVLDMTPSVLTTYVYAMPTATEVVATTEDMMATVVEKLPAKETDFIYRTDIEAETICGTMRRKKKRDAPTVEKRNPIQTPSYLSGKSPAYVTEACHCAHLPVPTVTMTITSSLPATTMIQEVIKLVTVDVTELSITGTEIAATQTEEIYETVASAAASPMASSADWIYYYGYAIPDLQGWIYKSCACGEDTSANCTIIGADYGSKDPITVSRSCHESQDCVGVAKALIAAGNNNCYGVYYNSTAGTCYLLNDNPITYQGTCGYRSEPGDLVGSYLD
ncbi:hypothetical protein ANO11243_018540 [Dothideomycetidae sp. 11243]|nr:hypothetical protein ANO11243_018540 [fungal sp. No.11243]